MANVKTHLKTKHNASSPTLSNPALSDQWNKENLLCGTSNNIAIKNVFKIHGITLL